MQQLPPSPSQPTIPPLTAQRVFASWPFDFKLLMWKANFELDLSMHTVEHKVFLLHALNFSVTIHAIADNMWHSGARGKWPRQEYFLDWVKAQQPFGDCVGIFIDISNTYKHSERYQPNRFIADFQMMTFPEDWVASRSAVELRNRIVDYTGASVWPVMTSPNPPGTRSVYYRYAAEAALHFWRTNYSALLA